ncbi:MAG: hypothetical protein BroJett025_00570 [Patescibacteria group bacterium]|nr:MAG: hypothetical protein BroJett025_00570 [Patescibacteria group bacterium]
MSNSPEHRPLSKVKLYNFSVGGFISDRSFLAQDEITKTGVAQAQEVINKREEGLLVYFAHLGLLDIFGTAAVMEDFADFKAVFPVAASWFYFPALRPIFEQLIRQVPHEFIPVFRKEELGTSSEDVAVINFSGLSQEEMKSANRAYAKKAEENLHDGGVVMLAPYGGRAPLFEHLRSGSIRLLQSGRPVIFSLTHWNWRKLKYEVFFSKVYRFSEELSKDDAHNTIYTEYARMAQLCGVTRKQMLESKSGSPVSRGAWKFLSKLITLAVLRDEEKRRPKG